jgi:hypothetical protein
VELSPGDKTPYQLFKNQCWVRESVVLDVGTYHLVLAHVPLSAWGRTAKGLGEAVEPVVRVWR